LTDAHLAAEWQGVHNHSGNPKTRHVLEKIIGRGRWKSAMQFAKWQSCQQTQCVEMAAMVRHNNKRTIRAQIFVSDNFETVVDPQEPPNDQRDGRPQPTHEPVRLAGEFAKPVEGGPFEISQGMVAPLLHRSG
jgi:hypothetical protein